MPHDRVRSYHEVFLFKEFFVSVINRLMIHVQSHSLRSLSTKLTFFAVPFVATTALWRRSKLIVGAWKGPLELQLLVLTLLVVVLGLGGAGPLVFLATAASAGSGDGHTGRHSANGWDVHGGGFAHQDFVTVLRIPRIAPRHQVGMSTHQALQFTLCNHKYQYLSFLSVIL